MSSITSIGGSNASMMMSQMKRPDPAKMVDNLFSKLDTSNKGYLEKTDFQSAFSQMSGSSGTGSSSSASVDEMFQKLDGNGDGKLTKDEMSSGMKKMADALDSQFNQMRMNGGRASGQGGMPPPPYGADSGGFSKDQLTSMSKSLASTDSARASTMSDIANNFDKADSNGNGKVSGQEAMAYEQGSASSASGSTKAAKGSIPPPPSGANGASGASSSSQSISSSKTYEAADTNQDGIISAQEQLAYTLKSLDSASSSAGNTDNNTTSASNDARILKNIMDLMQAYSGFDSGSGSSSSSLSLVA